MNEMTELTAVVRTDAGMHALWDVAAFDTVDGYGAWARELEDASDIQRHVTAGHFVPINIGSDGVFCITVRVDQKAMPTLSSDEERRLIVRSDVYRLKTSGRVGVSGIEHVGKVDERVVEGRLAPGEYDVVVHLMDYDDVPERRDEHPDFVVTLGPSQAGVVRTAIATFAQ